MPRGELALMFGHSDRRPVRLDPTFDAAAALLEDEGAGEPLDESASPVQPVVLGPEPSGRRVAALPQGSVTARHPLRWLLLALLLTLATTGWLGYGELQTSAVQARYLSRLGGRLGFRMEPGPAAANSLRYPGAGPYDLRLGYALVPRYIARLSRHGYAVEAQARISPEFRQVVDWGLFPVYREKDQAGLLIVDDHGRTAYSSRYPEWIFDSFSSIPPLVVVSLLFIENRELLSPTAVTSNPAIEWDRLAKASMDLILGAVREDEHKSAGASTLATQLEKYRHSAGGVTASVTEKLRQMGTASLRAYLDGEQTLAARRRIVLSYVNTVPLSARAGYGEVNGLGDGLWAWYGTTLERLCQVLGARPRRGSAAAREQARLYKQALSLFIAQRRPSYYLRNADSLDRLTNVYLGLLAGGGVIAPELRDAARRVVLKLADSPAPAAGFAANKGINAVRGRLAAMLGVPRFYDLDRIDMTATSTLDLPVQRAVTKLLRDLSRPDHAKAAGLYGHRLLSPRDDLAPIVYSFTLLERSRHGNAVRIQTDNYDQPFDINEGVKLELGSTAKLRTLVTYLDVIRELHQRYAGLSPRKRAAGQVPRRNVLARWALAWLGSARDTSLQAMLEAAMDRQYSANPHEGFFTGGGRHVFSNFTRKDDGRVVSVREALQDSVNLVFVRIMRDIERYYMWRSPDSAAVLLEDGDAALRAAYLAKFADREGSEFLRRFHRKYRGKAPADALDTLLTGVRLTPAKLAVIYNSVEAAPGLSGFRKLFERYLPASKLGDDDLEDLLQKYTPQRYSLADRGYIARVHPLELWVLGYLSGHPGVGIDEVLAASAEERQEVYRWLFRTRHKNAQDRRIRYLLEIEAFSEILLDWKRTGYPFDSLVPSYATALGSSADRPAALAELMGIIVNDGMRYPTVRVERVHLAEGTPYEALLGRCTVAGERVLAPEVARAARNALLGVVHGGTARRLGAPFVRADGTAIPMGGKTGTGDNRFDVFGRGGALVQSRVVSRTATFVFFIGERFYGTLTAYVAGPSAGHYRFTSALPVQILKALAPTLAPMVAAAQGEPVHNQPAPAPEGGEAPEEAPVPLPPGDPDLQDLLAESGGAKVI